MFRNDINERDGREHKMMTRTLFTQKHLEPWRVRIEKNVRVCASGQVYCLQLKNCSLPSLACLFPHLWRQLFLKCREACFGLRSTISNFPNQRVPARVRARNLLLGFLPIHILHFGRAIIIVFPMAHGSFCLSLSSLALRSSEG